MNNVNKRYNTGCGAVVLGYMAIDQYGETYHIGDNPPRKWLLDHFCRKSAEKLYIDTESTACKHIGYIIAGHWLTVYGVLEWKGGAQ